MSRLFNVKSVLNAFESLPVINYTHFQSVRFRRKPRWIPTAKSKMFKVPPRAQTPPDEMEELKRLNNNYRTLMKSIRSYLHNRYNIASVIVDTEVHEKEFLQDFLECSKINDEWNEQCRLVREARHAKELEEAKNEAYKRLDERQKLMADKMSAIEEIVRREKLASENFITPENIDEAIEVALANVTDYNFAIDLDGNVYQGRETNEAQNKKETEAVN